MPSVTNTTSVPASTTSNKRQARASQHTALAPHLHDVDLVGADVVQQPLQARGHTRERRKVSGAWWSLFAVLLGKQLHITCQRQLWQPHGRVSAP